MDMLVIGDGTAAVGFALHIDSLQALEGLIPEAIKQGFPFLLVATDDRGQSVAAMVSAGVPLKFVYTTTERPKVDEERVRDFWKRIQQGRLELGIPAIDIDNMPQI